MGDPIPHDFARCVLSALNSILPGFSVQNHVEFGNFRDPAAIDLSIKLNREFH